MNLRNFQAWFLAHDRPQQRIANSGVTALWVLFWLSVAVGLLAVLVGVQG